MRTRAKAKDAASVKEACLYAMELLTRKDYTESLLRGKLAQRGFSDIAVDGAIGYVSGYGYIDDAAFARGYIANKMGRRSRARIANELYMKGIDARIAKDALDQFFDGTDAELNAIVTLLDKKGYDPDKSSDPGERNRIYTYLIRQGFKSCDIRAAMSGR